MKATSALRGELQDVLDPLHLQGLLALLVDRPHPGGGQETPYPEPAAADTHAAYGKGTGEPTPFVAVLPGKRIASMP